MRPARLRARRYYRGEGRHGRAGSTLARRARSKRIGAVTANRLLMKQPPPSATQDAVFQLLGNPASFGLPAAAKITHHQTHAAIVFLSGDRVLKVKRAVQYPFLDFSSLEKRKAACEAELVINRKFAPQLYRRRVPITRERDGALALDGNGEPVECAVEMAALTRIGRSIGSLNVANSTRDC